MGNKASCPCGPCKQACQFKPGWFRPEEPEKAAAFLGVPFEEFFRTRLAVDWWEAEPVIFVLSPAMISCKPGVEFPADPRGTCDFFKGGLCEIHAAKPFECLALYHDDEDADIHQRHWETANAWRDYQEQIVALLGRQPAAEEFTVFDYLNEMARFGN
jgi:Fe-S-cluster containining protein